MIWGEFYEEMFGSEAVFPRVGPWRYYNDLREMGSLSTIPHYGWVPHLETRPDHRVLSLTWNSNPDPRRLRNLIDRAKAAAPVGWLYVAYQQTVRDNKPLYSVAFFLNTNRSWSVAAAYKNDLFRCVPPAFLLEAAAIEMPHTPLSDWERIRDDVI